MGPGLLGQTLDVRIDVEDIRIVEASLNGRSIGQLKMMDPHADAKYVFSKANIAKAAARTSDYLNDVAQKSKRNPGT